MLQKLAPDPFLILLNNQKQPLHTRNSFKNKVFWKSIIKKPFRRRNKFRKIHLFDIYYLTKSDDEMWSSFWVIPKITSSNLYKSIHDIINYSTSICPFESGKCGKEGKNHKNLNISRRKRAFKMKYKTFFIVFKGLSFGEKIKYW